MVASRKSIGLWGLSLEQTLFWVAVAIAAIAHLAAIIKFGQVGPDAKLWEYGIEAQCALQTGHGLCDFHIYSRVPYPSAYMPPLLSYLWLGLFRLFGDGGLARVAWLGVNWVVSLVNVALLFWLARAWRLPVWSAFFAALILALYPTFFYVVATYHQTEWAVLFLLLLALLLTQALQAPRFTVQQALLLGLVAGLGALNRTEILIMGPLLIAAACAFRRVIWPLIAAGVVMIAVLTPWTVRNYITFHRVIPVAQSTGFNLWKGYNRYTEGSGKASDIPWSPGAVDRWDTAARLPAGPLYETQLQDTYQAQVNHYIATAGLPRLAQLTVNKVVMLWLFDWTDHDAVAWRLSYLLPWLLANALAVYGAARLVQTRAMAREGVLIMTGVLLLLTAAYAATSVNARYRMHIEPFLFLLAGVGVEDLLRRLGLSAWLKTPSEA